jgi:hypothetical protein
LRDLEDRCHSWGLLARDDLPVGFAVRSRVAACASGEQVAAWRPGPML